jgi:sodium/proline symporter
MFWYVVMLVLYLAVMLYIGYYFRKSAGKSEDSYLVADRKIGPIVGGAAFASNYTSTSGFLGAIGLGYAVGIAALCFVNVSIGIGGILSLLLIAPFLRRSGLRTFPEFFGERYGSTVRAVSAIITAVIMYIYIIAQLKGGALVAQYVFHVPYWVGVLVVAVVFIIYVSLGGMYAATWTGFIQFSMMLAAAVIVFFAVLAGFGGWTQMVSEVQALRPHFFDMWGRTGTLFNLSFGCVMGLGMMCSPHILIRFYAARDPKVARNTVAVGTTLNMVFYFTSTMIVTGAVVWFKGLKDPDFAYIMVTGKLLSPVIAGIFFAAIWAAAMSTTDAQLIAAGSAISHDLYPFLQRKLSNNLPSQESIVKVSRIVMIIVGAASTLTALKPPGLIVLIMALAMVLIVSSFFIPLVIGIWWKRANSMGAIFSMIGGFLAAAIMHPVTPIIRVKPPFLAGVYGVIISLVLIVVVSYLTSPPGEKVNQFMKKMHDEF